MDHPEIQYIDRDYNGISPRAFLEPLTRRQIDTQALYEFITQMDYSGCVRLGESDYTNALKKCPDQVRHIIDKLRINKGDFVFLRGNRYHLDISNRNDIERIRSELVDNLDALLQVTIDIHDDIQKMSPVEKALYASILDHHKHYAMIMTFGIYNAMIDNQVIQKEEFTRVRTFCEKTISNYYSFVVKGNMPVIEKPDKTTIELFKGIELPKDRPDVKSEQGARKLVHRDLDHAGQIILYSGNLLQNDESCQAIDLLLNPLFGSIELGFGLRSIYDLVGVKKIEDIQFIRYSRYGEKHKKEITDEDLCKYIPESMIPDLEAILVAKDNRVVIMDDGIFRGNTLLALQKYIRSRYSRSVGVAAVEIAPSESVINQNDLITPAIAVRSIVPIMKIIYDRLGV